MNDLNKSNNLKYQRSKYYDARNKLDNLINKIQKVDNQLNDKKIFYSSEIDSIAKEVQNALSELRKTRNRINDAIWSLDKKIKETSVE